MSGNEHVKKMDLMTLPTILNTCHRKRSYWSLKHIYQEFSFQVMVVTKDIKEGIKALRKSIW